MTPQSPVGVLVKRFRLAAGLSQEALAARARLSARAISDLERGLHRVPRLSTLDLLAGALSLTPEQRAILLAAARPSEVAPSVPPPTSTSGLPLPPTRLLGRTHERAHACALVRDGGVRLLTLTGPGGVGKTRLALQIAEDLAPTFADGVVFIDLASITDPVYLLRALALGLGLREEPGVPLGEQVRAQLDGRFTLVLLDTFEHLLDAAPDVAGLLAACRGVAFLVTSRAPLHLRAEHTLAVAPLEPGDAIALFRERARAVREDADLAGPAVAAICERCDNLPLAIELSAALVRVFTVEHLSRRVDERYMRSTGPRDLPARQRTLTDAITWSYDLLTEPRQRVFRALGVFVGGWTVEAATAVCEADVAAPPGDLLSALVDLTDASLIVASVPVDGVTHFRMLDVMRAYALERLRTQGEEVVLRQRHAAYYADLADVAAVFGSNRQSPAAPTERNLANARAAMEWAEREGLAELGLRLAGFARQWHLQGQIGEAVDWQERMLSLDERVRAQGGAAAPAARRVERLYGLARTLLGYGQLERAEARAIEARQLARETGDEVGISQACATVGMVMSAIGRVEEAADAFSEGWAHAHTSGRRDLESRALYSLAELARLRGELARAGQLYADALVGAEAVGNAWDVAVITTMLGHLASQQGRHAQAHARYRAALALFRGFETPSFTAWCLEGLAALLCEEGRSAAAVRLCAAAAALREQARTPLPPSERRPFELVLMHARDNLGEPAYEQEWAEGAAFTREAAIAEALGRGWRARTYRSGPAGGSRDGAAKLRALPRTDPPGTPSDTPTPARA